MNSQEMQAIKQMIERFFEGSAKCNTCLDGRCSIARGGYDLAAQIMLDHRHSVDIVCGDYNGDKYTIESSGTFESRELANLLTQVFDKLGISYDTYSFIAQPNCTFNYSKYNFYSDEKYRFNTLDFEVFTVTNLNRQESFKIQADQFIGEALSNLVIKKADKETIKGLIEHFSESDFHASHAYGDLAVNYNLLRRVPFGEEALSNLYEEYFETDIDEKFVEITYGNNHFLNECDEYIYYSYFIDDDNETFFYEIFLDRRNPEQIPEVQRVYQDRRQACDLTEEQFDNICMRIKKLTNVFDCKVKNTIMEKE